MLDCAFKVLGVGRRESGGWLVLMERIRLGVG